LGCGGFFEAIVDVGAEDVAAFSLAVFANIVFCLESDYNDTVIVFVCEFDETRNDWWFTWSVDEESAFGEDRFFGINIVFGGRKEVFEADLAIDRAGGAEVHRERVESEPKMVLLEQGKIVLFSEFL